MVSYDITARRLEQQDLHFNFYCRDSFKCRNMLHSQHFSLLPLESSATSGIFTFLRKRITVFVQTFAVDLSIVRPRAA